MQQKCVLYNASQSRTISGMEHNKVGPKDIFLWAGAMASLYAGVFAFISLIFDYINAAFPNPVTDPYYYYDPYFGNISYETATLIVLTPVFMVLMRLIRRDMADDASRRDTWVRRWAIFITLFIAAATMVIDVIVLLTQFLQGEEMTTAFLLKVLTVFLVAGAAFLHFMAELRGYWHHNQATARMLNWAVGVLVIGAIVSGFFIIGTPQELRKVKQDDRRVQDLQNLQWQIVNHWQQRETLPATLADLRDPLSEWQMPSDPVTKEPYVYRRTSPLKFTLCANFATERATSTPSIARPMDPGMMSENWQHGVGETCFDRTIDPERYPPYPKTR